MGRGAGRRPRPLAARLLNDPATPGLLIDCDAFEAQPFGLLDGGSTPVLAVCDSFEDEAHCAAAQVLEHLRRGEHPVALIAQDRVLVRRVRALHERQRVGLLDETGWKLSTTRAAAQVMALLRAARIDALFDWLKTGTGGLVPAQATALAALESACRRQRVSSLAALGRTELEDPAARLWAAAAAALHGLASPTRLPLRCSAAVRWPRSHPTRPDARCWQPCGWTGRALVRAPGRRPRAVS